MITSDLTFAEYDGGQVEPIVFFDIDKGTIHLNVRYDEKEIKHYDPATNREFSLFKWLERNMEAIISHETIHLSIAEANERDAAFLLNDIDRRHGISGIDLNVLNSEFTTNSEENKT